MIVRDPLSETFRANVLRIAERRHLNLYRLGRLVFPDQPSQARYQLVGRPGNSFTLTTVYRYATALGVSVTELLTDERTHHMDTRAG